MLFVVDGVDLSTLVQDYGVDRYLVYRNSKSRVTIGGTRYINRVSKMGFKVPFEPMSENDLKKVVLALDKPYVSLQVKDPIRGVVTRNFIPQLGTSELEMEDRKGITYWSGLSVSLEEQ